MHDAAASFYPGLQALMPEFSQILGRAVCHDELFSLSRYLHLLATWNLSHGLLARAEVPRLLERHLLDCVRLVPLLPSSGMVLDMGSGNGFPGIPMAIFCPARQIFLCEANQKKGRFLHYVISSLGLSHVTLHIARMERLPDLPVMHAVTARAFASLSQCATFALPHLTSGSILLLMKGFHVEYELDEFLHSRNADLFSPPQKIHLSQESIVVRMIKT